DRHPEGTVLVAAEVGGHLAAAAERGVEAPISVVPRQGEGVVAGRGNPRCDDFAVSLMGNSGAHVVAAEVGGHLAAAAEGAVEAPIGVVPRQREVAAANPCRDDLAVTLDG